MRPGARLGHYEILSPLGKGGMGEVWKARDTTLHREVAVKMLPEGFAQTTPIASPDSNVRRRCWPR